MKYQSNAFWPSSLGLPDNKSSDTHDTYEQACAICDKLESDGFGGKKQVFPTSTWVSTDD